jgi:hypothetical protein
MDGGTSIADAANEPAGPRTLVVLGGADTTDSDRTFFGRVEPTSITWIESARLPNR